jgi:hypothetical protein
MQKEKRKAKTNPCTDCLIRVTCTKICDPFIIFVLDLHEEYQNISTLVKYHPNSDGATISVEQIRLMNKTLKDSGEA